MKLDDLAVADGAATAGYMTEERRMIQEAARRFTENEVTPVANRLDPERGDIPESLREKMAEMGYFGIMIPEAYGGLGLGRFEYCLITEELARGWMSVASLIARGNGLAGAHTMSDAQKHHYLPRVATGEFLGALAMSEANAGSDVANISCRAERTDAGWVINGAKYWCTFADGADYILVVARTDPAAVRHKGLSSFLLPKPRGRLPDGVQGSPIPKIGYFGWKTWELAFEDCQVPADALVGEPGQGFYIVSKWLESARVQTAARSIGCAAAAFDEALRYAQQRVQFGRPISDFQAIRFKLAQMATEIEAARQLMYSVCAVLDSGRRADGEAAMAKYFAAEMAERVTSEAMQILGGAGYTTHFPVERYWRDARLTKIFEGTSEIQLKIISDQLLGKVAP